jgi:hypothetical protein
VLKTYQDKNFVVLAINIHPNEDVQVPGIMKEGGYDFITLKAPAGDWATKTYGIMGTPANFLLDEEGRVIFRPAIHSPETARLFEQEVQSMLDRLAKKAAPAAAVGK